jgi:hypothetical protein
MVEGNFCAFCMYGEQVRCVYTGISILLDLFWRNIMHVYLSTVCEEATGHQHYHWKLAASSPNSLVTLIYKAELQQTWGTWFHYWKPTYSLEKSTTCATVTEVPIQNMGTLIVQYKSSAAH